MTSLFSELKRRNVFRIAALYLVGGWIILQVADVLFGLLEVPAWGLRLVLGILILGFPVALVVAWVYEMTPEGLKRERDVRREDSITTTTGRKLNAVITGTLAVAVVLLIADRVLLPQGGGVGPQASATTQPSPDTAAGPAVAGERSVAVLPFVDMSPQKDQEYFTDGLTENLLNALAQLKELKVAGRTSSFAFKNRNEDLRGIGQQLGVRHVLEGSVQKSGQRVRITAQLVSANDGYHLWSQTYDRTLEDIFAVQDEIATEVARAMQVTLLGEQGEQRHAASADTSDAYNDYLKGLYERNRGNMEGNQQAITYFRRALDKDPGLALAWAGLASSLDYVTGFADTDFTAGYEEARACALKALELDPTLPEAHLALAGIQSSHDWDWPAAEASLQQALAQRPGDAKIRLELAQLKALRGKRDEAFEEYQRVVEQDPLDWNAQLTLATALSIRGRYPEAQEILDRLLEIDPQRPVLHWFRGRVLLAQGDNRGALAEFAREPFRFLALTGRAITLHRMGQREQSVATLQELITAVGESASYQIAEVYAQWGDADNAISWLERGFVIRDPGLQFLAIDPMLDPIRDDPRFQDLLRRMNLGS